MTRKDYGPNIATALRLITKFGQDVVYYEYEQTPDDATKPWDGPSDPIPSSGVTLQTAFVPPAKVRAFGITTLATDADIQGFVNFYEKIGIVAPEGNDMTRFSGALINGEQYGMDRLAELNPAGTPIVSFAGFRR